MLLEFSVANFLSFQDKKTLSLIASSISDYKTTNVVETERHKLLNGAIIYGANASGKSNLIRAMSTMSRMIARSFEQTSASKLDITPFLLSTKTENKPSHFEIVFLIDDVRYRYGFEVNNSAVLAEWLFETKKKTEKALFLRENDGIEVLSSFKEAKDLEEKTRDNALFLNVIDQFNGETAKKIIKWFKGFIAISGLSHEGHEMGTIKMLENDNNKSKLLNFYTNLDLGFDKLTIDKEVFDSKKIPSDMPESLVKLLVKDLEGAFRFKIKTLHKKFNEELKEIGQVEFDMRSQESAGTNKVFNISGALFSVLHNGGILVVDELDSTLHPLLTLAITRLFNSKEDNPKNAQLVFTTHDTNLFEYGLYRRDQIYFVEKNSYGASDLYSLVEYKEGDGKKIRKDRSFEDDYINGRYGAIPYIGNLTKLVSSWQEK